MGEQKESVSDYTFEEVVAATNTVSFEQGETPGAQNDHRADNYHGHVASKVHACVPVRLICHVQGPLVEEAMLECKLLQHWCDNIEAAKVEEL